MKVEVKLFGAFRDHQPDGCVHLELAPGARVDDLRLALEAYASAHWPAFCPKLLKYSAFASEKAVLREADPVPEDGRMAVLPPVSGG
ncbi:MAG: MoaD/ThiS family protein [Chiayiivirga sp.]|uniref:Thiamine biosynthesis protein ThiS n=1 Tax=Denitratimonas tolerans TaxID=1338420 RepID=A0AAW9R8F2_9GAMM|nr:MoaD/ThiS family protein [Xanthomonadaceae bacterium]MDX9764307.1 MoaD/ThiS family protein [Chiayiivirga sp.]MEB2315468.1 MoaD/ThiS family protein [Xanthomonadaceae bacterium]HRO86742.1 MoaD/ThiS family protein [Chiayiivirga sp.]HRQ36083.1 MoaD/ThiS family protein [Chiayiivirga sp.]